MRGFALLPIAALALLPIAALAGCAGSVDAPSLAPRPAEAIDPRLPVQEPVLPSNPSPKLVEQLRVLVAQALGGDSSFQTAADAADRLAAVAGAAQSESWAVAQQALSVAVAERAPVTNALAGINAIGADRIQAVGGIGAADLKAINAASVRIEAVDSREAGRIDRLQARLGN